MVRVLAAFLCILLAGPAFASGRLDHYPAMVSRFVGPRDVTVWTPDGYDPAVGDLPVIYMQDGENLYDARHSLSHAAWDVEQTVSRMIRDGRMPPVIIVGVSSTPLRGREYLPAGLMRALPTDTRAAVEESWGGPALGEAYERFLIEELKPFVDAHYRTRRDAPGTYIIGSSMGGLIAIAAAVDHPEVFGGAAALSMHVLAGGPAAMVKLTDPVRHREQMVRAFGAWLDAAPVKPSRHKLYMDAGDATLDAFYAGYPAAISKQLTDRGWKPEDDFVYRSIPGGAHSEADWARRLDAPLSYLLGRP